MRAINEHKMDQVGYVHVLQYVRMWLYCTPEPLTESRETFHGTHSQMEASCHQCSGMHLCKSTGVWWSHLVCKH